MTTVVLAKNIMASDSQITSSYFQHGYQKIFETDIGVYGMAGDPYNFEVFAKGLDALHTTVEIMTEEGEIISETPEVVVVNSKHRDEDGSTCIFFIKATGKTGLARIDEHGCVRRLFIDQPIAMGSGELFAMTALQAYGASTKKAVEVAISLDPMSGGEIVMVKCKLDKVKK